MSGKIEVKEEYRQIFIEESQDQIQDWEESLLSLEKNMEDREQIDRLFRAIHTLKGSAGFVGFEVLQTLTHDLETALQDVRDGNIALNCSMIEVLLEGHDISRKMINAFSSGKNFNKDISKFLQKLESLTNDIDDSETSEVEEEGVSEERTGMENGITYCIKIEITSQGKEASLRSMLLQQRFEGLGEVTQVIPPLEDLGKGGQEFKYEVILRTEKNSDEIENALNIDQVNILSVENYRSERGGDSQQSEMGKTEKGKASQREKNAMRAAKIEEVVRVPVDKLDVMLNLVGELVVQNSGFISTKIKLKELYGRTDLIIDLEEKTEVLANIARDLQDAVMKVRMLPVAAVFNRFNRVVRDLAKDRGKEIHLEIYGEETEIDKKVMDRIGEPLVHLVRNSVDHGIETVEERTSFGKDEMGHIRLGAYQEGDHICIEISDDGRGLDKKKILKKALKKGLVNKDRAENMNDEEAFGLIFLPGFSTAEKVTDISGRGVGLDVVKRTVEEMGGVARVKSTLGRRTTITITLPLTMAIIPAMLVEASGSLFAIPLSSVREVIKVKRSEIKTVRQHKVIRLREDVLSVADLKEVLDLRNGNPGEPHSSLKDTPIVIVDYAGRKIGIGVEKLHGNEEIVIKSLSRHYKEIDGIVGASIMGTGKIALILDVEAMVRRYYVEDLALNTVSRGRNTSSQQLTPRVIQLEQEDEYESPESDAEDDEKEKDYSSAGETDQADPEPDQESEEESSIIELVSERRGILEEINTGGAITASMSMSELMDRDIRVSFPETKIVGIGDVASELGGEESPVGGLYVKLKGDIDGGILLVLPMDHVFEFSDLLFHRELGATKEITEEEISGLIEMGNILSASFLRSMADKTNLNINQEVPEIKIDMCLPVIDSILAQFNQPGEHILLTEAELYYGDMEQAICYLLLFMEPESLHVLVDSLNQAICEEVEG